MFGNVMFEDIIDAMSKEELVYLARLYFTNFDDEEADSYSLVRIRVLVKALYTHVKSTAGKTKNV